MKKLSDVINESGASNIYLLEKNSSLEELEDLARRNGLGFFLLEGEATRSKDEFLRLAASVLKFPEYFGHNWDAFEDCLTDMSWHEAPGYLLLFNNFESFMECSPGEFRTVLEIFQDSAAFWAEKQKMFVLLLRGVKTHELDLPMIGL